MLIVTKAGEKAEYRLIELQCNPETEQVYIISVLDAKDRRSTLRAADVNEDITIVIIPKETK